MILGGQTSSLGSVGAQLGAIGLPVTSPAPIPDRIVDLMMRGTRELPTVFRRLPNEEE